MVCINQEIKNIILDCEKSRYYLINFSFLFLFLCKNEYTVHMIHINYSYIEDAYPKFLLIGYTIKDGWSKTIKFLDGNTGESFIILE